MLNRFFAQVLSRRYAFTLFYALLMLFGWLAFKELPVEQLPNTSLPSLSINYYWGRSSSEVMEQEITRKIEQIASRLRGVQDISSNSSEGIASVTVVFQKSVNINLAQIEWTENLKVFDATLPLEVRRGEMIRTVPDEVKGLQSFISYSISGPYTAFALKDMAEERIQLPLSGLNGLAKISINGVLDPVLTIRYNANVWNQLNLEISSVMYDLNTRFQWQGAGFWNREPNQISILSKPIATQLDSIRAFPIKIGENRWESLGNISEVLIEDYPANFLKRINGEQAITIEFAKETGADALSLADEIHSKIQSIQKQLPADVVLRLEKDTTQSIRDEINDLAQQSFYSILFVFVLLLVIIRRLRAPLYILSSILFSLLFSFLCMSVLNQTLNTFTMAALTISIGMLVDNAIVVFEHLEKKIRHDSKLIREDIIRETKEVLVPVMGNMLTTIGVFFPLIFSIPSLRYFLDPFGIALGSALLGSALVSLTWIPFLFQFMNVNVVEKKRKPRIRTRFWLKLLHLRYRLRYFILATLIISFGLPFYLVPDLTNESSKTASEFRQWFEKIKPNLNTYLGGISYRFYSYVRFSEPWSRPETQSLMISIVPPKGTPMQELDKIVRSFEQTVQPYLPFMQYSEAYLNESSGAYLNLVFNNEDLNHPEPFRLKGELMYLAARTGNTKISVSGLMEPSYSNSFYRSGGGSYSIELTGYNYDELVETAERLRETLERDSRVKNVDINREYNYYNQTMSQYVLDLDDFKLMQKGISRAGLMYEIRSDISADAFYGSIFYNHRRMFIRAINSNVSERKEDFMDRLRFINHNWIRLSELSNLRTEGNQSTISRKNQKYTRLVSFDYMSSNERARTFRDETIKHFVTPIGVKIAQPDFWASWQVEETEENANKWYVFAGAILIVLFMIAALLNRWKPAIATIGFIALGFIGVAWTSLNFDFPFGRGAYSGVLLLAGVIVNNGILLYHEKKGLVAKGVTGVRNSLTVLSMKLRSVWLTTLTTLAGLLPLMLWGEDPFWSQMALIVFAGMAFSTTMITLVWGLFVKS